MEDPHPSAKSTGLEVVLLNRQRARSVQPARIRLVLREAAARLGIQGEVAVLLAGDRRVRALNRRYRGLDRATDVLSFPGPGGGEGLGDIVIGVETAERNARRLGRPLGAELELLALHGLLHLLGYDHEADRGEMRRLEQSLQRRLRRGRAAGPHRGGNAAPGRRRARKRA